MAEAVAAPKSAAEVARDLADRLREPRIDVVSVGRFLDGLGHEERAAAVRSLGRAAQRRLYAAAEGAGVLRLADLVPAAVPDGATVRHLGRNTLPAFTHFEKRFSRPRGADPAQPEILYGFNFQTLAPLTGPGYFTAREDRERGEVRIDYTRIPEARPEGWPPLRGNEGIPARFVYGFMVDTLRRVSETVSIGSAARRGRDLGSWFALTRTP